ncbi:hypothetical protein L1765_04695 [Microaerobacter geothermalis]|uniref:hypothetical protein n=1 Tax=Microaerobacter geothermalis TaxID=674972 RepID=UPI001F1EEACF|nr:hypothetical protein [Microaerobacter geothermalis]MCF6093293.1 hypothetical protein [Microaerobacter geothermalis]
MRSKQTYEKIYVYVKIKLDDDNQNLRSQERTEKAKKLSVLVNVSILFFNPELLQIPKDKVTHFLKKKKNCKYTKGT